MIFEKHLKCDGVFICGELHFIGYAGGNPTSLDWVPPPGPTN